MTPEQLARALKLMGLTQTRLAQLLGVDSRSVRHWVAGTREANPAVAAVIKTWLIVGIPGQLVAKERFTMDHALTIAESKR